MDYSIEKLRLIIESNNGIATSKQLLDAGFSRLMLYNSMTQGLISKESHGNYYWTGKKPDDYVAIQNRSEKVVFSHLSALFLQNICVEKPTVIDFTVAQGVNVARIKRDYENARIHYCRKELKDLGKIQLLTAEGFKLSVYDIERSICDLIRDKKQMDEDLFVSSIKEFFGGSLDKEKLLRYAELLHVKEAVHMYMQVL